MQTAVFEFIEKQHFKTGLPRDEICNLFKRSIKMVEIETFSYCNRKCWFCPNSFIDRFSENIYLDEQGYLNILEALATINYSGMISFSRYNEPLADKIILKRMQQCKKVLPKALIHTNTNGDYLDMEYLGKLYDSGLRSLNIQVYLGNEEKFDDELVLNKMKTMLKKLPLPYKMTVEKINKWYEAELMYKDMTIRMYARNFLINGCNRGESINLSDNYLRTSPCLSPFYHIYIDYNGNVVPCCNIRSDNPKHKKYVLGNIFKENIFDIYGNNKFVQWRRSLFNYDIKKGVCKTCEFVTFDNERDEFIKLPLNKISVLKRIISYFKKGDL